jgi:hypothetical protein
MKNKLNMEHLLLSKSVVLYGTIRNIEDDFLSSFINLELISKLFKKVYFIILENDSTDSTRKLLINWSNNSTNKTLILKDNLDIYFPLRATRLAYCRNEILNFMKSNNFQETYDYAIHCDLDNRFWCLNPKSIFSCFEDESLEWDMMSAVSKNRSYYDFWALKCEQSWFNINIFSCENKGIDYETKVEGFETLLKNTEQLIPVLSSFNGLAIYKTKSLLSSYYDANYYCSICKNTNRGCFEDNDHIGLHRKMIYNGCKLFINNKIEIITREEDYEPYQQFIENFIVDDLKKNILTYILYNNNNVTTNKDRNCVVIGKNLVIETNTISKFLDRPTEKVYYLLKDSIKNGFECNNYLNENVILCESLNIVPIQTLYVIYFEEMNYELTKLHLNLLYNYIGEGTIIVFKKIINYDNYYIDSIKAFYEFVQIYKIEFQCIGYNSLHNEHQQVAIKIDKINKSTINNLKIDFNNESYVLFDWIQYTNYYSDLIHVSNKEHAYQHWIDFGEPEGRRYFNLENKEKPSIDKDKYEDNNELQTEENESLNWEIYLDLNKDLVDCGINTKEKAIEHWVNYGKTEKRKNKFDWCKYINYFNLVSKDIYNKEKAIEHWISNNFPDYEDDDLEEKLFDWIFYITNNKDLSHIDNMKDAKNHWIYFGKTEGRKVHDFDWMQYLLNNPYLIDEGIDNEIKVTNYWLTILKEK